MALIEAELPLAIMEVFTRAFRGGLVRGVWNYCNVVVKGASG